MISKKAAGIGLAALLLVPLGAFAAEIRTGEQPSVSGKIADDIYVFGGNVNSAADIVGDLVAGGGNVLINGSVSQDLAVGGGSVTVLAKVGDDARVGGGNVTIAGAIGGDLIVGGGQVQITGSGIQGDLVAAGGVVRIDAPVRGDVTITAGSAIINAPISGNVVFKGEKLELGAQAAIIGTLSYESPQELVKQAGATVRGDILYTKATSSRPVSAVPIPAILSIALLVGFMMRLVGALAVGLFFRRYAETLVGHAVARPLTEIGRGLVVMIVLPIVSIALLATVIGIPLGMLGLIAVAALSIFSWLVAPIILGAWLRSYFFKTAYIVDWKTILLGAVAYTIIGLVPFIGWIVICALILVSLGAMTKIKADMIKQWR